MCRNKTGYVSDMYQDGQKYDRYSSRRLEKLQISNIKIMTVNDAQEEDNKDYRYSTRRPERWQILNKKKYDRLAQEDLEDDR